MVDARTLVENALLLRMYGDISHMPMSQREWDTAAEEYLRGVELETSVSPLIPYLDN